MGGKFAVLLLGDLAHFSKFQPFVMIHILWEQWLGVDKELKKLVVETTANQVNT